MKKLTQRTFDDDIDKASAKSAEMLTQQILRAGLPEMEFTRLPFGPRKLRGAQLAGTSGGRFAGPSREFIVFARGRSALASGGWIDGVRRGIGGAGARALSLQRTRDGPAPEVKAVNLQPKFALDSPQRRVRQALCSGTFLRLH